MVFRNRWTWLRLAMAVAALAAALAVSACGDSDDDGGDAKAPSADSTQASDGNANASNDGGVADGGTGVDGGDPSGQSSGGGTEPVDLTQAKLTAAERQSLQEAAPSVPPYKGYGFDRGTPEDKQALMSLFRKMQRDFYNGRFMAFCKEFGGSLYALPDLKSADTDKRIKECAAVISRLAKRVATGEVDWPPHAVQWVRIYHDAGKQPYGGITVLTRGSEVRLSYVERNGRWRPDMRVPGEMKAINAR